MIQSS
ncbi:hypothetical protein LINPERPRIM_LOCUS26359 [Linum perenne]